jgi:hypothetical protein
MSRNAQQGDISSGIDDNFLFTAYENCKDLNNNGKLDPGEMTNIIVYYCDSDGAPDYHN